MIKDSLTLYEELIAAGVPDMQAKVQAHQLGSVNDGFIGLKDALTAIKEEIIGIKKDMVWMRIIGAAMIVSFLTNVIWAR